MPAASARWAAALALARAGIDAQVCEQAQQRTEASADASLAPNGLRMLKRLGVGEGIGRVAARHPAFREPRIPEGSGAGLPRLRPRCGRRPFAAC